MDILKFGVILNFIILINLMIHIHKSEKNLDIIVRMFNDRLRKLEDNDDKHNS